MHKFTAGYRETLLLLLILINQPSAAEDRVVRVGLYQNEPKIFTDINGQPAGFFPQLLESIARAENWTLQYIECAWEDCLDLLEKQEIDLMPDVARSEKRSRRFDLGKEVVLSSWSVIYIRPASNILSIMDLDGKRLAVLAGSIQYQALQELAKQFAIQPTYLETDSLEQVFALLETGAAAAGLVNNFYGRKHSGKYGLDATGILIHPSLLGFAVSKGDPLAILEALDRHTHLQKNDKRSTYHQARQQWLEHLEMPHYPDWWKWALISFTSLLVFLLILVFVFRRLIQKQTRELAEKKNHFDFLAHHDLLTTLPNRLLFFDRLAQSMHKAQRDKSRFTLFYIDLDQFKQVNDCYGHVVGDEVLQAAAKRFQKTLRKEDTVARLGGDEFSLIIESTRNSSDISSVAAKLIRAFQKPMRIASQEFTLTLSIGITVYPGDGEDPQTLLRNADTAMFKAKEQGRNNFCFYTRQMTRDMQERIDLEARLRQAIMDKAFTLHYQPKIALQNGAVIGLEALLRWQTADGESIPPDKFIPLAEETGLIVPLGEWVLLTACRQMKKWREQGLTVQRMAVNLSGRQLNGNDIVGTLQRVFSETDCKREWLELEVTEGFIMSDISASISILRKITELGIELSVDDFGTGYSSLAYLKQLPIAKLKIDRSFVTDIPESQDDMAISRAIIALAHNLNLRVIAEGVETREQLDFLQRHGCHEAQGYFLSRPLPPGQMEEFLHAWQGFATVQQQEDETIGEILPAFPPFSR